MLFRDFVYPKQMATTVSTHIRISKISKWLIVQVDDINIYKKLAKAFMV